MDGWMDGWIDGWIDRCRHRLRCLLRYAHAADLYVEAVDHRELEDEGHRLITNY